MILLIGLLLMIVGLVGSLYLHDYIVAPQPINMTEVTRRNLVTGFIACLVIGIVVTLFGTVVP